MKIFKRKKIEAPHQLLDEYGWGTYDDIPDDFDPESWIPQDTHHFESPSFRQRIARNGQERLNRFWFKKLVSNFARSVFDIGYGDFGTFVKERRYKPRADYLLNNNWVLIQFGIYLVEYTIVDGVAYSHYSLNYGLKYVIHMETQLVKKQETNQLILIDLFRETEQFLFNTLSDRTAPYSPNFLFR